MPGPKPIPAHVRLLSGLTYEPNTGCWLWTGAVSEKGYGLIGTRSPRATARAHRVAYEHFVAPLSADALVMHSCDTPCCCNPEHLRPATASDNTVDMQRKGRSRFGGRACLKPAQIEHIRLREMGAVEYARLYGVTSKHIQKIQRGVSWRRLSA
jgi:hypothetical protein